MHFVSIGTFVDSLLHVESDLSGSEYTDNHMSHVTSHARVYVDIYPTGDIALLHQIDR